MAEYDYTNPETTVPMEGVLANRDSSSVAEKFLPLDRLWARGAFLIGEDAYDPSDQKTIRNRYWSTVNLEFTDTRIGCNIGLNPKPQFCAYSDIVATDRLGVRNPVSPNSTIGNYGKGRYYGEAIDRPAQRVFIRCGFPQFTGLLSFLTRAYDARMTEMAKTGRGRGLLYEIPKAWGTYMGITRFPPIAILSLGIQAISFAVSKPTSKFYTMKPTMAPYWASVENLVNHIAIVRGLLPKVLDDKGGDTGDRLGQPYRIDSKQLEYLNDLMPEVFGGNNTVFGVDTGTNNYIQVASIINRAQRIANQTFVDEYNNLDSATATNDEGYLKREITGTGSHSTNISSNANGPIQKMLMGNLTVAARLNKMFTVGDYKRDDANKTEGEKNPQANPKKADGATEKTMDIGQDRKFADEVLQYMDAEFRDGSQFAVFKVDHTGSVQESFSNSLQESDLSSKINGISSTAKQARFTFADGKMTDSGVEAIASSVMGAAVDVGMGLLDGLTMGGSNILRGLSGAGYIDIPKNWQSSNAQLPRASYTIQLISPYGNVVSQLQNIYIPLCMLLAGTLPLSTGKSSYTSPFLCQIFDRGRCQVQLGMIESLSITRGTSNLAFNTKGNPLAIDVTFTVADLSSIMHMPIASGGLFATDTNLDGDNIMADYIAVLAGQDLYSQLYAIPKAKLRFAKALTMASRFTNPQAFASGVIETFVPSFVKDVIEGANRGSAVLSGSLNG